MFRTQGLTHKHLKGHTKWVFCLNYNTASNLLVSGGCDGDVRIWNAARGFISILYFFRNLIPLRQMHENTSRTSGLCHSRSLQPGRYIDSVVCPRWLDVCITLFVFCNPTSECLQVEFGIRVMDSA